MKQQEKKHTILQYKLLFTTLILLFYLIGKNVPLYGIDVSLYLSGRVDADVLLIQSVSGDVYRCSMFALGISPYMIASLLVQMVVAVRKVGTKSRISPKKINRITLLVMYVLSVIQAIERANKLVFLDTGTALYLSQAVAIVEMITGAMIIVWLSERNKRYGVGGQTVLIFINILDGLRTTLQEYSLWKLIVPLLICIVVVLVTIVMENAEKRIPLQRISIHNVYADKNYLAIKLNPIGVMPAVFSTVLFMLPQLLVSILHGVFPNNSIISWWVDNLMLTKPLGLAVYILVIYIMTMVFSRVFVNPADLTEQFLKSGDSIPGLHAGRDTKRYLSREIRRISMLSATVMSICLLIPMLMQFAGYLDNTLAALPASVMMLTGTGCNLYREVAAIRDLDAYHPFI